MKNDAVAIAVALMIAIPGAAMAQTEPIPAQGPISLTNVAERGHVTLNGGAMVMTNGDDWSGASLGAAVGYNLHPQLTVFGAYDHGIPVNEVDHDKDFWRLIGSMRVHRYAFVGFGYGWFGDHVDGGVVQLLLQKSVMPRVKVSAVYAHVFADAVEDDFEYGRVFVNYHLFGKE